MNKSTITGKRIIAFLIDFYLSSLPLVFFGVFSDISPDSRQFTKITVLVMEMFILFRDPLFGGRSIGKRLTGLVNVDIKTYQACTSAKLILKTLMLCLGPIEIMVFLFSHVSIGERLTNIYVMHITNPHIIFPVSVSGKNTLNERSDTLKIILTLAVAVAAGVLILIAAANYYA